MSSLWHRLPLIIQAVLLGIVVAAVGGAPWVLFVQVNAKFSPSVPWAAAAMAEWLYLYWRYFSGAGWPHSTAKTRQDRFRRVALPKHIWWWALLSGTLGVVSLIALELAVLRMVRLPVPAQQPVPHIPLYSLVPLAVLSAFAAGIPEEVGFRGYMQVPLERRHGARFAILVVALVFTLAHLNHGLSVLLLFDFAFGVVFGMLAWLSQSLLPAMILHCLSDVILFVWGKRIAAALAAKPLVWVSGPDLWFLVPSVAFVLLVAGALLSFSKLARVARP
jgi:membrane protease YdiL (CAAX protease family)